MHLSFHVVNHFLYILHVIIRILNSCFFVHTGNPFLFYSFILNYLSDNEYVQIFRHNVDTPVHLDTISHHCHMVKLGYTEGYLIYVILLVFDRDVMVGILAASQLGIIVSTAVDITAHGIGVLA